MKKLIQTLRALPDRLMQQAKAAAVTAAETAAQIAWESVPVDTGELKNSISSASTAEGAVMQAAAPHAPMVEYGTSKMPPQPFMLPAALAVREQFFKSAGENIK